MKNKQDLKYLAICEDMLKLSDCSLIHFACALINENTGQVYAYGINSAQGKCRDGCLKDKIKDRTIGKNPSLCHAYHAEWVALGLALIDYSSVEGATLYIVGKYPDGSFYKNKNFACTVCARLLTLFGVARIKGPQFSDNPSIEDLTGYEEVTMSAAYASAYKDLIGKLTG